MKSTHRGTVAILCCCILFSAPTLCSAEDSKPDSAAQGSTAGKEAADKAKDGKPAGTEEAKKKPASDDEPGCNN